MRIGASVAVGVFVALHVAAAFAPARLWGVDMAIWAPLPLSLGAGALVLALAIEPIRRRLSGVLRGGRDPWARARTTFALVVALAVVLAVASAAFPSAVPLLGDGLLVLGNLDRWAGLELSFDEIQWDTNNAPLSTLVLYVAQRAVRAAGGDARSTLRLVDLLAGVAWVTLSVFSAKFFLREASARSMLLAFLLTGGWMALFFGHVEVYAIVLPGVLAFLWVGAIEVRARRFPAASAVVLGVAWTLHAGTATLTPALAFAAAGGRDLRSSQRAARSLGALLLCAATALGIAWAIAFDAGAYLTEPRAANFYPIVTAPTFRHAYRLLAPAHFIDVANQLLLVAPAAVLGAGTIAWRRTLSAPRSAELLFLAIATVGPLLFLFVANPEIGAFRDWDTMAFTGVPLTLLIGVAMTRGTGVADSRGLVVAGTAAVHTLLWIACQTDAARSEARFLALLEAAPVSRHARGYGWESAGTHFRQAGRNEEAGRAYERAIEALPENARLWTLAGESHLKAGRYAKAQDLFARALELDPESVPALAGQGAVYANLGEWERAISVLESAVRRQPAFHPAWYNLGIALANVSRSDESERAFLAAVSASPDFSPAWLELGRLRARRGDPRGARSAFLRFLEVAPTAPEAEAIRAALRAEGENAPR